MIDKKIMIEKLEKRIAFYEEQKEEFNLYENVSKKLDISIKELNFIIDDIKLGYFDGK